jgi:hypothetical protein
MMRQAKFAQNLLPEIHANIFSESFEIKPLYRPVAFKSGF